jgi:NADH:ubiquinone oxidoreductase subunit C
MNAEMIAERLGTPDALQRRSTGDWLVVPDLDVRAMAELLLAGESRFITLTVIPEGQRFRFVYHWDVDGVLLNIVTHLDDRSAVSIADILPAADWVEREVRDYYAIEFSGRSETPTLMLQEGDEPGLFTRTTKLGRDADPADIGWSDTAELPTEEDR